MAMNVPTWANEGVSPSAEKKAEGYAAGECLPAQHLNWFLNQTFSNLAEAKSIIDKLQTTAPYTVITGTYTGTNATQTINIGVTPDVILILETRIEASSSKRVYVRMAIKDSKLTLYDSYYVRSYELLEIVDNGFTVKGSSSDSYAEQLSMAGITYNYVALVKIQ